MGGGNWGLVIGDWFAYYATPSGLCGRKLTMFLESFHPFGILVFGLFCILQERIKVTPFSIILSSLRDFFMVPINVHLKLFFTRYPAGKNYAHYTL